VVKITVEELDIVVQASVEGALKEFQKLVPKIRQVTKQMTEHINKSDFSGFAGKVQQAIKQVKQKLDSFKSSNKANNLEVKVTTEDAKKQITQLQKQIDSLQAKINARQMKLDVITPQLDRITEQTVKSVTPDGVSSDNPAIQKTINNSLSSNKDYTKLSAQESKLTSEISAYNRQLSEAKAKMSQLNQEINQTATSQNKLTSFFSMFKNKISEAKTYSNGLKSSFNQMPKLTQNITNNIKNMGSGIKQGLRHVLRYAGALFSLRGIYSILSSSAQSWLSSQNAGAQQLSANINYMKYAMGSALAPVIQWVTNLVYQLMKAIQSVAYALTGVNIFAKATASSYSSMAGSAKKAKEETKQLAGIHDEINNIQSNNSDSGGGSGGGATPSFDLSKINPSNSILDAIKNGNWYDVGATIGQKLNEAMDSIPWDKIQNGARKIGTNIAQFLNGFIATANWTQVGNTFAQALNTIIYFGYSFITTFNWKQFGKAIGDSINGFFKNVDWATAGQTLGEGIKGVLGTISTAIIETDWAEIGKSIATFLINIDWYGVLQGLEEVISSALVALFEVAWGLFAGGASADIKLSWEGMWKALEQSTDVGMGIQDDLIAIGAKKILENMGLSQDEANEVWNNKWQIAGKYLSENWENFKTTIRNKASEIGNNIADFAKSAKEIIGSKFTEIKNTASNIWNNIHNSISNAVNNIKNGIVNTFQTAYNSIKNIFSGIGSFFSGVWNTVRNSFSNLGTAIGNAISNSVKSGINGVISMIERTINSAIGLINGAINLINKIPGVYVGRVSNLYLPRLAKGGVLTEPTAVLAGEYSGAKSNPEIVTPQNIMYDTMRRALSDSDLGNNNDRPINLTLNVGNKKIATMLIDELRDMRRRTGNGIEVLVGG